MEYFVLLLFLFKNLYEMSIDLKISGEGLPLKIVSDLYYGTAHERDFLQYARLKDEITGKETLVSRSELIDPEDISVGDEDAYKVEILTDRMIQPPPLY